MSDRKPCIRCERQIDRSARVCPFCNWDQTEIPPRREAPPAASPTLPPAENRWRGKMLAAAAFVVIIAFVAGMLIHGFESSEVKAAQTKNATSVASTAPPPRSRVTLVPVTSSDAPQSIEQPITSAPPQTPGQQPNDATALPADEYAAAAARAKAEREAAKAKNLMLDPRMLTGSAYEPSPRINRDRQSETAEEPEKRIVRTQPIPESQPVPQLEVDHDVTARLNLTIDADGRVREIDVDQPIREMSKLIAAVQNWRFKPATENGTPVAAHFSVEITFRAHE